jgi:hypothetical protein
VTARLEHRATCDLFHSALDGHLPDMGRFVIEMTPAPSGDRSAGDMLRARSQIRPPAGGRAPGWTAGIAAAGRGAAGSAAW